jgi:hypothetical protein
MKSAFALAFTFALSLVGCGEKSTPPAAPTNAPANVRGDYLSTITRAEQSAIKTVDTTALTSAISMFQVDKGRWPKDLNELVAEKFIPKIPEAPFGSKIVYDANTGTVKVVKQ